MTLNWSYEGNLKFFASSTSWTKRSPNPNLLPKSSTDHPSRFHSSGTPDCARSMSLNPLSFPPLPSQDIPHDSSSPTSQSSAVHISPSDVDTASTTSEEDDLAEQAWQESLDQLTLLFNLVLLPFAGKYFGRKFAYFSMMGVCGCGLMVVWARWMEYRWPVEVVFSSKKTFNLAGIAEAALT